MNHFELTQAHLLPRLAGMRKLGDLQDVARNLLDMTCILDAGPRNRYRNGSRGTAGENRTGNSDMFRGRFADLSDGLQFAQGCVLCIAKVAT